MPGKCVVPNCKSGYNSCKEKVSLFKIPVEQLDMWNKNIPRVDRLLTVKDHVCEKHFSNDCIIKEWISEDGLTKVSYKVPRLRNGAVPTIFPDCRKYFNKKIKSIKRTLSSRTSPVLKKKSKTCLSVENDSTPQPIAEVYLVENTISDIFENLWNYPELVILPESSWGYHKITLAESRCVAFVNLKVNSEELLVPVIERQIIITDNLNVKFCNANSIISCKSWKTNSPTITTVDDVIKIIAEFSLLILCTEGSKVSL